MDNDVLTSSSSISSLFSAKVLAVFLVIELPGSDAVIMMHLMLVASYAVWW